jgi:hypothetical protein
MAREFDSVAEILDILLRGAFDELKGGLENEFFDAKSEPWDLDQERGKLDLAKDITSLANWLGGVIVIGAATAPSATYQRNEIQEIHALPVTLVPTDRYAHVVREWIYPVPDGIEFRWYGMLRTSDRGLIAVHIPNQNDELKPFLVAHYLSEAGKRIDAIVGLVQRLGATTNTTQVQELHRFLREGRRLDAIHQKLDTIIARRLEAAIEVAQLSERSVFALTAKPFPDAQFKNLFAGDSSTLVQKFNKPPMLRRAGFSLEHDGNSRIVMGDLRRALVPSWKIIELWRDGALIYAVDALVQPFWGSPRPDGSLQLNPLALAEPVFLFAEMSKLIYEESVQKFKRVQYRVNLNRLVQDGKRAILAEGPLQRFFFEDGHRHTAPEVNMNRTVTWEHESTNSELVAYELIQEVYHWFGISDDGIPYTRKGATGTTVIDPEALKKAGAT